MSKIAYVRIDDLNTIRVLPIPAKPLAVVKAVRVERLTVLIDAKGVIYASGIKMGFAYGYSKSPVGLSVQHLVTALGKLGVLTPKAAKQWTDEQTLKRIREDRRWAASQFADGAKMLGLRLTDAQARAVQNAEAEGASNG